MDAKLLVFHLSSFGCAGLCKSTYIRREVGRFFHLESSVSLQSSSVTPRSKSSFPCFAICLFVQVLPFNMSITVLCPTLQRETRRLGTSFHDHPIFPTAPPLSSGSLSFTTTRKRASQWHRQTTY
ncbi:hypothetical protein BJX68DRAFT_46218 [Aspergillus pseudodeflectus]|uniref:Uncharacterized protein n=1 Tax=Aspergillus pseudodeflectus TaxID=176178 RepID=A0ABR4KN65_9EURO